MVQKVDADEMRDMSTKDLQRFIGDQNKKKIEIFSEETGSTNPIQPSESIGTIKRNIARAKTILNERTDRRLN